MFGVIIPILVWVEENKLSSVFQSLGILTAFLVLFTHIIRENKKAETTSSLSSFHSP